MTRIVVCQSLVAELACVIKIFVARLVLTVKKCPSKWTAGTHKKKSILLLKMMCLLGLNKRLKSLKHVFCKYSVFVNLNSMKCSKTTVGYTHKKIPSRKLVLRFLGPFFVLTKLRTENVLQHRQMIVLVIAYIARYVFSSQVNFCTWLINFIMRFIYHMRTTTNE